MAKKITGYIKLQLPAGEATPAPPVGPALGQQGVSLNGLAQVLHTPPVFNNNTCYTALIHAAAGILEAYLWL